MNECTRKILHALENSFRSLKASHTQRESEKDKIIIEQKETIDKLRKLTDFMDGFAMNYANFKNSSEPSNNHEERPSFYEILSRNINE